jgi:hypothetical protein
MPRICGIIRPDFSEGQIATALNRLIEPLVHSANFKVEHQKSDGAALARILFANTNFTTHLSTNRGAQILCAFVGYLFDIDELRKQVRIESQGVVSAATPADIIAYMFPRRGAAWLTDLNGSFVFALWDGQARTLTLGTDRYGMIPLYYRQSGRQVTFASEIKALVNLDSCPEVNLGAVHEIFILGSPQGDHTMYSGVFRLPPATVMAFRDGRLSSERYWWYDRIHTAPRLTVPEFVDEAIRLLGRSVNRLMAQIERPICFLSAGYDSRRILVEMARHGKPIVAYTAPTAKNDSEFTSDVPVAKALCAQLGVEHVGSQLSSPSLSGHLARRTYALLDFEADTHAWILPLLRIIPAGTGINFDGLGGDVLYEFNWTREEEAANIHDPAWLAQAVVARYPDLWNSYFRVSSPYRGIAERYESLFRGLPNFPDRYTAFYFTNWTRRKTALFAYGLLSLKVESVFPFLDYDLVDFVFKLSPVTRRGSEVSKSMLRNARPDLMHAIPTSHDDVIGSDTNSLMEAFRDRLPAHYWLDSQAAMYRSAAADILRADGVFSQLSTRARIAALGFHLIRPSRMTPHWLTRRSWTLRPLGLYALQRRIARDSSVAQECLSDARQFVYGR